MKTSKIYPFDKGAGLVRVPKVDAIRKIEEQIENTEIIKVDPTTSLAMKFWSTLRELKTKQIRWLNTSDPIPPRMYGAIKAHKPEKNYPMRIIVSTIGTPRHKISENLVKLIQPNSETFVNKAKNWTIEPDEVQVSYDVVNLYPSEGSNWRNYRNTIKWFYTKKQNKIDTNVCRNAISFKKKRSTCSRIWQRIDSHWWSSWRKCSYNITKQTRT